MIDQVQKVTPDHRRRDACIYIRQGAIDQLPGSRGDVEDQFTLRRKAVALGWTAERVVVIDCDSVASGASTRDRKGFRQLIVDVAEGRVGMVLALEVSRLTRSWRVWDHLLHTCASSSTLIMVNDHVYDPLRVNDRLLLAVSGPTAETEPYFGAHQRKNFQWQLRL